MPPPQVCDFRVQGHVLARKAPCPLPDCLYAPGIAPERRNPAWAKATTDSAGHFEIAYDSSGLPAGKNRADLLLRVFPDSQAVKPIFTRPATVRCRDETKLSTFLYWTKTYPNARNTKTCSQPWPLISATNRSAPCRKTRRKTGNHLPLPKKRAAGMRS